jgi:4'-phosphopantetheinyl transferase
LSQFELKFRLGAFRLTGYLRRYLAARRGGVDLEPISSELAGEDIAQRFFSANDATRLLSVPASERQQAFFNCWTRKEAFIKAKGTGLSLPLDQFDVTLSPGEPGAARNEMEQKRSAAVVITSN